jgi:predicted dehydrogenase
VSGLERRSTVDDTFMGLLEFPNGICAQFEAGIACTERHRAEVAGTTGTLVIDRPWHPGTKEARFTIRRWDHDDEIVTVRGANPYFLEVEEFVDVCCGGTKPRWSVQDAVDNMTAIDALFLSARDGQAVHIPTRVQ